MGVTVMTAKDALAVTMRAEAGTPTIDEVLERVASYALVGKRSFAYEASLPAETVKSLQSRGFVVSDCDGVPSSSVDWIDGKALDLIPARGRKKKADASDGKA